MDEPILKTPGEVLAEAREAAGLTLARLGEITKIPVRQLESIERDEYHKLSGPLYVKSFLRAYADAVGVEAATVLDLYARASGERRPGAPGAGADVWTEDTVTISRVGWPWGRLLGLGAAVVLAATVIWLMVRTLGGGGETAAPSSTPAVTAAAPDTVRTRSEETTPVAGSPEPETAAPAQPGAGRRDAAADSLARSFAASPAAGAARTGGGGRGLPAVVSGADPGLVIGGRTWPLRLRVLTRTPLRMQVRWEGTPEFQVTDVPGEGGTPPPLPAADVEPGAVYAAQEGFVAYWGAVEYFEFGLDRVDGVEITVNGVPCAVGDLAPDATRLLHASTIQPAAQR